MIRIFKFSLVASAMTLAGISALGISPAQAGAPKITPTYFVDPTAAITGADEIHLGNSVYVAPFATLRAGDNPSLAIHIGAESNVQDNVVVDATTGAVSMGE